MTQRGTSDGSLRLEPVAGPEISLAPLQRGANLAIGRAEDCKIALIDPAVSRRHATLIERSDRWLLTDLGGKTGTTINGVKLNPHHPVALAEGDLVRIGPWTFRVNFGRATATHAATIDDTGDHTSRVQQIAEHPTQLARQRLNLLIDCAAAIAAANDEKALADAALQTVLEGTGFQRGAIVRTMANAAELDVISSASTARSDSAAAMTYSRTLLREAAKGQTARLSSSEAIVSLASLADQGITAALCSPIMIGTSVDAFLYVDARGGSAAAVEDAVGFCQVIARLCGMALANIKRRDLEQRQKQLEQEVSAAREAQQFIVPEHSGAMGPIHYAMRMRPGRFVAGDLFDIIQLDDTRVAALIGDVTGYGVGAAMLMVAAQSHLHAALRQHADPAAAVNIVNQYLTRRGDINRFISLWVGIIDLNARQISFVDAGHGHWLHKPATQPARLVRSRGGLPVGIVPEFIYEAEVIDFTPGDRLILYSDGVTEQPSAQTQEQFGRDRVIDIINGCGTADDDVQWVLTNVERFAQSTELADDTTVASIQWTQ